MAHHKIFLAMVLGLVLALTPQWGSAAKKPTNVNVINDPTTSVPVEQAPREIFRMNFGGAVTAGTLSGGSVQSFLVPADTLLVIETVSGSSHLPAGQLPQCSINTFKSGNPPTSFSYYIPLTKVGVFSPSADDTYLGSSPMRIYAQAGEAVSLLFSRSASSGDANFTAEVSGYVVALPPPPVTP